MEVSGDSGAGALADVHSQIQANRALDGPQVAFAVAGEAEHFDQRRLYLQVGELLGEAITSRLLARISVGDERATYLVRARTALKKLGRQDLIDSLEKEFPTPPSAAPK
jgi:hypothetical protein